MGSQLFAKLTVSVAVTALCSLPACSDDDATTNHEATGGRGSDAPETGGRTQTGGRLSAETGGRSDGGGGDAGGSDTGASGGTSGEGGTPATDPGAEEGGSSGGSAESDSVYGVGTVTFADDGSTGYLLLERELDFGGKELSIVDAREFAGESDFATHDGAILVASGDEPAIMKYEVGADLSMKETASLSFANYGVLSAAFWYNQFVADDKAYMANGPTEIIVWNPQTMLIEGTIELPELEERDGFGVVSGLVDRSSVIHDGKFYLPLYWTDENYAYRSDDSVVVVIDIATNTVERTIPVDCPGLDYATVDDDGILHFSNWTGGAGTYWVLGSARTCVASIDPETEEVTTTTFASIADGHEGAAFKYAGDGKFVMSVFDEVRADIQSADDPFEPVGGLNWQLWSYDPDSGAAAPIEDVDWNSGAIIHANFDGQLYSMVPGEGYATTTVYAVSGTSAEAAFGITGWSFRLLKVR